MNPYEMMLRSGVMSECRPIRRWQERMMINEALKEICPADETWKIVLIAAGMLVAFAVMFARWWMCV